MKTKVKKTEFWNPGKCVIDRLDRRFEGYRVPHILMPAYSEAYCEDVNPEVKRFMQISEFLRGLLRCGPGRAGRQKTLLSNFGFTTCT